MTSGSFKSGFAAIVGRPNVGKSTLVNALVGGKVAITSSRPQTTRSAIRGVLNAPGCQVVLVDTPGYHKPRNLLGERLNRLVRATWSDVDLVLFVVDGAAGVGEGDKRIAAELAQAHVPPVVCAVNKVDRLRPAGIARALADTGDLGDFEEFVPISAAVGDGVDILRDVVVKRMPEGPMYYPEGVATDQPPPVFVAELVREKLLERAREELPHSIAVLTEDYEERADGLLEIRVSIYVERESQKGMVIGKRGATLKAAGTEAREEIELLFGRKVYIETRVKVERDWQRRGHALDRLGFDPGG